MTRDEMNAKLRAIIQHCSDDEPFSARAVAKELLYSDFTLGTPPEARRMMWQGHEIYVDGDGLLCIRPAPRPQRETPEKP